MNGCHHIFMSFVCVCAVFCKVRWTTGDSCRVSLHFCGSTQTRSDLSVWSMCRGIRGAQLQYWCRTFDTVLTSTWAAVTPIMHQPATWDPPRSHAHLTASSVVFLAVSFYSEKHTHTHPGRPRSAALTVTRKMITDWIYSLPLLRLTDWIGFQRNLPEVIEKQFECNWIQTVLVPYK